MPIKVEYQPPAATVASLAYLGGQGEKERYDREQALREQQVLGQQQLALRAQNIDRMNFMQGLAARAYEENAERQFRGQAMQYQALADAYQQQQGLAARDYFGQQDFAQQRALLEMQQQNRAMQEARAFENQKELSDQEFKQRTFQDEYAAGAMSVTRVEMERQAQQLKAKLGALDAFAQQNPGYAASPAFQQARNEVWGQYIGLQNAPIAPSEAIRQFKERRTEVTGADGVTVPGYLNSKGDFEPFVNPDAVKREQIMESHRKAVIESRMGLMEKIFDVVAKASAGYTETSDETSGTKTRTPSGDPTLALKQALLLFRSMLAEGAL